MFKISSEAETSIARESLNMDYWMELTYSESLLKNTEERDLLKGMKDVTVAAEQKSFVDCSTVSDPEN